MIEKPALEELVLSDRKFLHEIVGHMVVAHGMVTLAHKKLAENKSIDQIELKQLEKSIEALIKMTELVKNRRSYLHDIS